MPNRLTGSGQLLHQRQARRASIWQELQSAADQLSHLNRNGCVTGHGGFFETDSEERVAGSEDDRRPDNGGLRVCLKERLFGRGFCPLAGVSNIPVQAYTLPDHGGVIEPFPSPVRA